MASLAAGIVAGSKGPWPVSNHMGHRRDAYATGLLLTAYCLGGMRSAFPPYTAAHCSQKWWAVPTLHCLIFDDVIQHQGGGGDIVRPAAAGGGPCDTIQGGNCRKLATLDKCGINVILYDCI